MPTRRTSTHQRAKRDYIIARLRGKIASLEETVKAQETQLKDLEGEGEDIQGGGTSYLSEDDDFEEAEKVAGKQLWMNLLLSSSKARVGSS